MSDIRSFGLRKLITDTMAEDPEDLEVFKRMLAEVWHGQVRNAGCEPVREPTVEHVENPTYGVLDRDEDGELILDEDGEPVRNDVKYILDARGLVQMRREVTT